MSPSGTSSGLQNSFEYISIQQGGIAMKLHSRKIWGLLFICLAVLSPVLFRNVIHQKSSEKVNLSYAQENSRPYSQDIADLNNYWSHIHAGTDYLKSGDFDLAKQELSLAVQKSRSHGDVWMARAILKRVLTQSGEYDLALKEVEWLYENNPRPDVREELIVDKRNLLVAKAQSLQ